MTPVPAGLWRLAVAGLTDTLVGLLAWSLCAMWLIVATLLLHRGPLGLVGTLLLGGAVLLLGAALHVVYHTVMVGGCGQTLGKMLLGVVVVRRDGAPPGYSRALLRCLGDALCTLTLGLGRLPVLFSREHRSLADLIAGTRPVLSGSLPTTPRSFSGNPLPSF